MAFTVTQESTVFGNKRLIIASYVNTSGSTGGDIVTGLSNVIAAFIQPSGSSIPATQSVVNETYPVTDGSITIVTAANESGAVIIIGD